MERKVLGKTASSYSLGVSVPAGRLIFISGTVAMDEAGNVIGAGDMGAQARSVFQQMAALLSEAGGSLKDIVKITTFVTDMTQYGKFAAVRKEVFGAGPYPASATVKVSGLVKEGLLVEVEAIAVI
jgi:enamine deaminase RidA (YjgF/YER057c/UK114 family)